MNSGVPVDPIHAELRKVERTCTYLRRALWLAEVAVLAMVPILALTPNWFSPVLFGSCLQAAVVLWALLIAFTKRRRTMHEVIASRYGVPAEFRTAYGISIVLPWRAAKALFKPVQGTSPHARTLERIAFWRSVAGLVTITVATSGYQSLWENLADAAKKTATTASFAMCAAPLVLLVLFFVTRPDFRRRFRAGVAQLLRRLLLGAISIAGPVVLFGIAFFWLVNQDDETIEVSEILAIVALVVLGFWVALYWTCTVYWAARTSFWTSDVHPLLAPAGSALLAASTFAVELVTRLFADRAELPAQLWYPLNACGLVTTLVLAVAEYRHLRGSGIGWSTGPDPVEPLTDRILLPDRIATRPNPVATAAHEPRRPNPPPRGPWNP